MKNESASSCLKPVLMMVLTQIWASILNILYKLVQVSGKNLNVLVAYRLMFSTAFMVPLAYVHERKSRPKFTWTVLFESFLVGLFGATMTQNLYIECLALTSPTFLAAISNLLPGITFVMALCFRMEKVTLGSNSYSSIAKIVGTIVGMGGAMLFTFYRGPVFKLWSTRIDLRKHFQNSGGMPFTPHRNSPGLGFLVGLGSMGCFAIWLIIQAKMGKTYPCPYSSTSLMSLMGSIQFVIFALCLERDWKQWKLGWDIRLLTVVYSGVVISGLSIVMMSWCIQKRGPLFVAVFSPLALLMVAIASSLFLDEKFTLGSVLGGTLIVCGLYIVLWGKSKEEPTMAPHDSQRSIEIVPSVVGRPTN